MEKEKQTIYYPTNDYVFCKIFGTNENKIIIQSLLNSILNEKINSVEIVNHYHFTPEHINDKSGAIDIKATINQNIKADIEMQYFPKSNDIARFLKYWAELYKEGIEKGSKNEDYKKTIVILIINYNDPIIDSIPKITTSWHIREDDFSKIILTDFFEFYIISLRKLQNLAKNKYFKDRNKKELLNWLKFVINPEKEEIQMENNEDEEALKKAYEEWKKINQNPEERELARLREKYYDEMAGSREYRN